MLNDLDGGRVLEVVEGRKRENADALWESPGEDVRGGVRAVAMDMWEAFVGSAAKNVPQADIVHDRYHVSAHLNRAVDQVRRRENRELAAAGDDTLKGARHLWLFNADNLTETKWLRFEALLRSDLRSAEAWVLKENVRWFWDYKYAAQEDVNETGGQMVGGLMKTITCTIWKMGMVGRHGRFTCPRRRPAFGYRRGYQAAQTASQQSHPCGATACADESL